MLGKPWTPAWATTEITREFSVASSGPVKVHLGSRAEKVTAPNTAVPTQSRPIRVRGAGAAAGTSVLGSDRRSETCATNRYPRRGIVAMYSTPSASPLSARRRRKTCWDRLDSSMNAPGHRVLSSSSFDTTRSRCSISSNRTSNAFGVKACGSLSRRSDRFAGSRTKGPNSNTTTAVPRGEDSHSRAPAKLSRF